MNLLSLDVVILVFFLLTNGDKEKKMRIWHEFFILFQAWRLFGESILSPSKESSIFFETEN